MDSSFSGGSQTHFELLHQKPVLRQQRDGGQHRNGVAFPVGLTQQHVVGHLGSFPGDLLPLFLAVFNFVGVVIVSDQHHGVLHRHVSMFWGEGQSCIFEMLSSLQTNRSASSPVTLWCPEQDVDGAGAVHLVLLGNDDGEGRAGSAHILQSLGQ